MSVWLAALDHDYSRPGDFERYPAQAKLNETARNMCPRGDWTFGVVDCPSVYEWCRIHAPAGTRTDRTAGHCLQDLRPECF